MKKSIKILSVFLAVLTFFSVLSAATPVFAEDVNEYVADKEYTEKLLTEVVENDTEEKSPIVEEVKEKRGANKKVYLREDGTYTAVITKTPVHYEKDGKWVDIVNSLKTKGDVLTNTAGNYNVEFPKEISEENEIKIENGKESITFSMVETEKSNGKVKNNKKQKQDKNKVSDEEIFNNDVSRTVSEIEYEDILENTNLEYVVTPNGVKENIIVENKESLKKSYSFNITKGKLKAELDKSNNLYFKNSKGEVVFTIPAPVMTDAKGEISYDIDVKVKNLKKETITLTYTPDKKWLTDKDRAYPVAIDPVIIIESGENDRNIEDTLICIDTTNPEVADSNGCNAFLGMIGYARATEDNVTQTLKYDVLVKLNMNAFAGFKQPDTVVTDVNFVTTGAAMNGNILLKEISGEWDSTTITGADVYPQLAGSDATPIITYNEKIVDYYAGGDANTEELPEILCFNITDVFQDWLYEKKENNGFALTTEENGCSGMAMLGGYYQSSKRTTYYDSYCTVDYIEASGYNSNFEYLSQDVGRAGSFYVNTFSRGLSGYREDLALTGNIMPVSLGFNYNGACLNHLEWYEKTADACDGEDYILYSPYGEKWSPNYLRALMFSDFAPQIFYFTETGSMAVFNLKEDEEGNITFEEDQNGESGYELALINKDGDIDSENLVVTTPSGETEYFDEFGLLTEIREAEPNQDGTYDKITITYTDYTTTEPDFALPKISTIKDGANRTYNFNYTNDKLISVTCKTASGSEIKAGTTDKSYMTTYTYKGNNLETVSYPTDNATTDPMQVTYAYDDSGNLTNVKNVDLYNITYAYDTSGKVTKITEKANDTTTGNEIVLSAISNRQTKIVDKFAGTEIHQFGKNGRINYIFDDKGNFYKSSDCKNADEKVSVYSGWDITPTNILRNGSFERTSLSKPTGWTNTFKVQATDENNYACKVTGTDTQTQSATVSGSKVYTFSIDAKDISEDSDSDNGFNIQIKAGYPTLKTKTETLWISPTEDFERYSVTVVAPAEITLVRVYIGGDDTVGEFLVDNAQLEAGYGTAKYNYIENGNFMYELTYWNGGKYEKYPDKDATFKGNLSLTETDSINGVTKDVLQYTKALPVYDHKDSETSYLGDSYSSATQTVEINGEKDEIFSLGGWFKGEFTDGLLPENLKNNYGFEYEPVATRAAQIKASYTYIDENGESQNADFAVDFLPGVENWQYANDSFALKGDVESINVTVIAKNIPTTTYFTDISLVKDEDSFFIGDFELESEIEYPTLSDSPAVISNCSCTNCEKTNCGCVCTSENVCECVLCKRGTEKTTDENANTVSTVRNDGNSTISTEMIYSDDGNYLESAKYDGSVISTFSQNQQYSTTSPLQVSVNGQTSNYTYNAGEHLKSVTKTVTGLSSGTQMKVEYDYINDRIVKVNHNNYAYNFEYDSWGNITHEKVNNQTIVNYIYGTNQYNKQLQKEVYENGQEIYYNYDSNGNVNKIKYNGDTDWRFTYDYTNSLETTIQDKVLNLTKKISLNNYKITDSNNNIIYSKTDTEEIYNNATYNSTKSEDVYNETLGTTLQKFTVSGISNSTKAIDISKLVDWFDRDSENTVTISKSGSTVSLERNYEYKPGQDSNATTEYIEKVSNIIKKNGTANSTYTLKYTYDSNGNIKTVSNCSNNTTALQYEYYYDEVGQLVRVDDYINNITAVYQYDIGGNIVSTKNYNRATYSSVSTPTSQDIYSYDSSWKDKLTSVNGKTLTYDIIGNLLTYNGKTHAWIAGRKLATFTNDNCSISFTYDENGLRSQKSVTQNGKTKTYKYTWMNDKLIGQSDGINTLRFIYDENDEVVGFVNNDSNIYLYMKNVLGDIISIVDENGLAVVNYEYDAWGKLISITGSLAGTIGTLNPIRYRSYYYDTESSYYYLNSRYYDPELKRFINADKLKSLYSPKSTYLYADSVNAFAYCANSPIRMVDYSGEKESTNFASYFINALVFSIELVCYYKKHIQVISDGSLVSFKAKNLDKNIYYKSKKGVLQILLVNPLGSRMFSNFIYDFYLCLGEKVFDAIAILALDEFYKRFPKAHKKYYGDTPKREFLFSESCVSKEIKDHVFGYWYAVDKHSEVRVVTLLMNAYGLGDKRKLEQRCKTIDIAEQDAADGIDRTIFEYYSGINEIYKNTYADPYYMGNGIRVYQNVRNEWKVNPIHKFMYKT